MRGGNFGLSSSVADGTHQIRMVLPDLRRKSLKFSERRTKDTFHDEIFVFSCSNHVVFSFDWGCCEKNESKSWRRYRDNQIRFNCSNENWGFKTRIIMISSRLWFESKKLLTILFDDSFLEIAQLFFSLQRQLLLPLQNHNKEMNFDRHQAETISLE